MKLKIENWLNENKFSENVNLLFKDSIICYKAGAYRASLLFSYLGFLTILKERIISSNKPNIYNQVAWEKLINNLNKEDSWEQVIFDATQEREKINQSTRAITKDAIFSINDNLREQIKYWKNRRNDCAHFKNNTIENYHIESFWAFVESNLPKITVEGGLQSLINKIRIHFDPTYTPPDKDITYLVKEVENSIENSKIKDFWEKFLVQGEFDFELTENRKKFIIKSFEINNPKINDPLIAILKNNRYYLRDFLNSNPEKILLLNFTDQELRKFWKTKIIDFQNPLGIYSSLLLNRLIPKEEILEANDLISSKIKRYQIKPFEHAILNENGFFESLKKNIFNKKDFENYLWVNERADLISEIIKENRADIEIINRLCNAYEKDTNSNWLLERFNKLFTPQNQITQDYKIIILENNITLPEKLQKYFA